MSTATTLFEKIASGQIPSKKVYEDEIVYAFHDITPVCPVHILVVPKICGRLTQLQKSEEADRATLGHLLWACGHVAKIAGLENGYRVVINDGKDGLQSVYHLHAHVIGGETLSWPPGVASKAPGSMTG
jgi:histidine triad (HIT) family protein